MTIDSKALDELDALHTAATPGPWEATIRGYVTLAYPAEDGSNIIAALHGTAEWRANGQLIAAACNALPHLTARVRELEAQLAAAQKTHDTACLMIGKAETSALKAHARMLPTLAYVDASTTIGLMAEQLAAAREDSARLDWMIEQSNNGDGDGWLSDDIWEAAYDAAAVGPSSAIDEVSEDYALHIRAAIDAGIALEKSIKEKQKVKP